MCLSVIFAFKAVLFCKDNSLWNIKNILYYPLFFSLWQQYICYKFNSLRLSDAYMRQ